MTGDPLEFGLYEDLLTSRLEQQLRELLTHQVPITAEVTDQEAADRFALHFGAALRRALTAQPEHRRADASARVVASLLQHLEHEVHQYRAEPDRPAGAKLLRAVARRLPDGSPEQIDVPITPLLDTTVLTNSKQDRNMSAHLKSEIRSAGDIDAIIAFIRRPGVAPVLADLRRRVEAGHRLRILTTAFTGFTEVSALQLLADAGAEIRVSYDTTSSRLHAKAWIFHRPAQAATAFVGSSNFTAHAMETGMEWNVRLSQRRNPEAVEKMMRVFDAYWESGDFAAFDAQEYADRAKQSTGEGALHLFDIRPHPFQERMLEQLRVARELGHHRNLLVSATGTGKTVMAALDYRDLQQRLPRSRLLFVAHRREILEQSLRTFRMVLGDPAFGETWVGGDRPTRHEHVFASIQSLGRALSAMPADHFDVVVVDEFHHAAATSYRQLLELVDPRELLGLTATPERADGLSVLEVFDGRIAAEMRLWDAVAEGRLTPFQYFGIYDGANLVEVPWRRGQGYDIDALERVYTSDQGWARLVIKKTAEQADITSMRALGFCVSVGHAQFMAAQFTRAGVASVAVSGSTPEHERRQALTDLQAGRIRAVFSVEVFNEGVDIPDVDTLLLLRPTESATLFLQQLGRGLRKTPRKDVCTVLDFVSAHRKEFRFDLRLRALLGPVTRKDLERNIAEGFPNLPPGTSITLDPVAAKVVLDSLRTAIPSRQPQLVAELRALAHAGHPVTLASFLAHSGSELELVYGGGRCFSDLLAAAGLLEHAEGPAEVPLRRSLGRLLHVDDRERLATYRRLLAQRPDSASLEPRQHRLWRMLVAQLCAQGVDKHTDLQTATHLLWQHPAVVAELQQLLEVLEDRIDHEHAPLTDAPQCPLQVHARYSRIEIQAALGDGTGARVPDWREGVRWLADERVDALLVTLNKTGGSFSPTTAYRDFALTRSLFHWESQSTTSADSPTGRRYRSHVAQGSRVLLFARMEQGDRDFWFLGEATYRSHEGSRPMAVTWALRHPIPADLYPDFAAVGAA